MQSILDYQNFDSEVSMWAYALIGRLMYDLNEADAWQVMPFLKGQAGSGKSTLLMSVCRNMYDIGDVGVLSNNIERKFGLSAFSDKYMFVAPEIKSDLQLEQAEFQSMISGETLQIAVKFKTAHTVDWTVPGIMAGNEAPGWTDNSGSIGRRVIIFEFMRKVVDSDSELGQKLNLEMPYIMLKCNRAYQAMVRKVGNGNIWSHLPEYFKETRKQLAQTTDPLRHFLDSNKLNITKGAYMPFDEFKVLFKAHCEENNLGKPKMSKEKMLGCFTDYDLYTEKGNSMAFPYPRDANGGGNMKQCAEWLHGAEPFRLQDPNNTDMEEGDRVFS